MQLWRFTNPTPEAAIKELQQSGFDMKQLSIVGRDYHTDENVIGYYTTGDRMKYWEAWELFGAGSGDAYRDIIRATNPEAVEHHALSQVEANADVAVV